MIVQLAIACSPSAPEQNRGVVQQDSPAASELNADTKLIVAFGDSLFAGYQLGPQEGFAPVLERALNERGIKAKVVNASVSGDTTAAGLARLAFALDGLARKPDLVIVGLGGNDMLRGLDPGTTRANLEAILAELKRREIPAMLTGMRTSRNMGAEYSAQFDRIYPELANQFDVPLYPFVLEGVIGRRDLLLADGIHPNQSGVEAIVSQVSPWVARQVASDGKRL